MAAAHRLLSRHGASAPVAFASTSGSGSSSSRAQQPGGLHCQHRHLPIVAPLAAWPRANGSSSREGAPRSVRVRAAENGWGDERAPYAPRGRGGRGGGRGRGQYGGGGRGGGGGYSSYNSGPRGPVSYDEPELDGRGGSGGRGRGRGGRGGGRGERRPLNPAAAAVNDAISAATSWRELQTVLEQQSRAGQPGLDPFQLVALLLQLRRVSVPSEGDDLADFQQFVASVYGWMLERLPSFKPRQIGGALFGISRLKLYNAELVGALVQASKASLAEFGVPELVRFMDGLAALGQPPDAEWVAAFFEVTADRIARSSERDELGALMSLCQRLGLVPTPEWLEVIAGAALTRLADRERQPLRVADFRKLLVGLAGLGYRPTPEQLELIIDRSYPQLHSGYPRVQDLNEIAWALAQWGPAMPANWARVFCKALMGQRRYLRPSDTGSILYSLAYLKAGPEPRQLDQLLDDLRNQFDTASGDDLASAVMAVVQFQYRPSDRYMDDLLIALRQKLPTCSASGLNNIMSALPAMGSGVRLNEVTAEAVSRYDALVSAQQYGGAAAVDAADAQQLEAAAAAAAEEPSSEAQPVA